MENNPWQIIFQNDTRYLALSDGRRFPTRHSLESLNAIYKVKGVEGIEWFLDEVLRAEFPNALSTHLYNVITQLQLLDRHYVLDFGAGSGASTLALAHLGFQQIDSVEISEDLIKIAQLRACNFGYLDCIRFHQVAPAQSLPFPDNSFDLIICYAVIEHIHPQKRRTILSDLWRVLKPQGVLLVLETPNILYPYGAHYPFLYFTPWMPLSLVKLYGRLRGQIEGEISDEQLYLAGLRGTTVWQVLRYLGNQARLLPPLEANPEEQWLASRCVGSFVKQLIKYCFVRSYQTFLKPLGVPLCALFPQLNFGIEKLP
ncbi:MAG: class I SAM-dependent methyltransferase, partial [Acidobacteriota bacterium]